MKYLHISVRIVRGVAIRPGETYSVGRNAAKRAARSGKPRKQWKALPRVEVTS